MKLDALKVFKYRDYTLLFLGQFVSKMGSSVNAIGLTLYVLKFDNPVVGMGTLSLLLVIPWIVLGPYAGVLADRYSKRTIIVICDITSGILSISLFFVSSIWLFYLIVFLLRIVSVIFYPAIGGYIPFIVKKGDIEKANSLYSGSGELAYLVGPAVGGFLVAAYGATLVFAINGISFIISGISEMFIRERGIAEEKDSKDKETVKEQMAAGLKYVKKHFDIKFIIIFFAIASAWFGGYSILYPTVATQFLKLSDEWYGIFEMVIGIGAFLGALIIPIVLKKIREIPIMVGGAGVYAAIFLLFALIGSIPVSLAIVFLMGISMSFINVTYGIFLQKTVEKVYIGRVFSLDICLSSLTMVISILFVTIFGSAIGTRTLMIVFSIILMVICFGALIYKKKKDSKD